MNQKNKEAIVQETLLGLVERRPKISSSTVYGEFIYDAFERMITVLPKKTDSFSVNKVYVLISSQSHRSACYIEGIDNNSGSTVSNIADERYGLSEKCFISPAMIIARDLDYLRFSEIESVWEILYKEVLPREIMVELVYDFTPPYENYKVDKNAGEKISAIIASFNSES